MYEGGTKSSNLKWNTTTEDTEMVDGNYSGWVDMFGWNTANNPLNTGLYARNYASKQTDFVDWGQNPIYDPKADTTYSAGTTWRTLSMQEFQYLLFERDSASQLVGTASIYDHPNGVVNGIIILPDNFVLPTGLSFKAVDKTHTDDYKTYPVYVYSETMYMWYMTPEYFSSDNYVFNQNRYTLAQWEQLEAAGAVFLPAAGERHIYTESSPVGAFEYEGVTYTFTGIYDMYIGQRAVYWTSTRSGIDGDELDDAHYLREAHTLTCTVDDEDFAVGNTMNVQKGQSVRLVRDL